MFGVCCDFRVLCFDWVFLICVVGWFLFGWGLVFFLAVLVRGWFCVLVFLGVSRRYL